MTSTPSLEEIAVELYSGSLADFVARRDERAKAEPDRSVSRAIRALRKPSVAAWVVDVFARERAAQLGEALQLAAELREAQSDLDARALAQLGRDRRALTSRLAAAAAELAEARGERVTASTLESVRQTISAAFFDPDAAAAVASGRLVRELEPSGTFADVMDTIVAGGAPTLPTLEAVPVDELRARRERKAAERSLQEAEQHRDRATREAAKADRLLRDASAGAEETAARVEELEKELAAARSEAERAAAAEATAAAAQVEAAEAVEAAEEAVSAARRALDSLGG